ncbi:MAG: UvrD-helicase domain-containing protein [Eubacterium sp.]|nr:UvrD-helicase domain-containing protein [Eubacterium sp.]
MAEIKWSDDQKKIINSRDCEILVSAAAGSGKTAVLVERIFQRMIDEKNPIDIDRFVVVTFTKAAAEHMKGKIRERIENAINSGDYSKEKCDRLREQLKYLTSANISTVHSFCSFIIGQYFHRIGIDPSLKLGDDYELTMLKNQVMEKMLEDEYAKAEEGFTGIASMRALIKNDAALEDWILKIYKKIIAEPFSELVFDSWESMLDTPLSEDSMYIRLIVKREADMAQGMLEQIRELKKRELKNMPEKYIAVLDNLEYLCVTISDTYMNASGKATGYIEAYNSIKNKLDNVDLSGIQKTPPKNEDMLEYWKDIHPLVERFTTDKDLFFFQELEESEKDRQVMARSCHTLLRLTKRFMEEFSQAKSEAGIMDYNDLEQFALKILFDTDEETGRKIRSEAAIELSHQFDEIMIDEYQDSNRVQDTILWAVSDAEDDADYPWFCGSKNRFMVGDVKQSIYRFRGACPELFEHKMETFGTGEDAKHRRIDLNKNFRSRPAVLMHVNDIFEEIMHADIGGIEYDEDACLNPGGDYEKYDDPFEDTYIDKRDDVDVEFVISDITGSDKTYLEASHIAKKIKNMVEGDEPFFLEKGEKRRVKYSDIVILARSVKNKADIYAEAFRNEGVPFHTVLSQGFYTSREISLMTDILSVIDNPRQDIPLAAVALGPMFGISEEKLSSVRANHKKGDLYDALIAGREEPEIGNLLEMIDDFREMEGASSATELLEAIYEKTGIRNYFALAKDGDRRCANLDYLMQQAISFDRAGHMGIHEFVRSFEKIKEIDFDLGEVSTLSENDDVVQLMTIHKSKGLEFPVIVLVGTTGEAFKDDGDRFVTDPELGIATFADDTENGIKKKTIFMNLIKDRLALEDKGEALRLLYVALTRAEEKIIISGSFKEFPADRNIDYYSRYSVKTYFDMLNNAVQYERGFKWNEKHYAEAGRTSKQNSSTSIEKNNIFDTSAPYNETVVELLKKMASAKAEVRDTLPAKISVSEVKRAALAETEEGMDFVKAIEPDEIPVPRFVKQEEAEVSGAAYGTVWHQVMAYIDFEHTDTKEDIEKCIDDLVSQGKLLEEEKKYLRTDRLLTFFCSELGQDMKQAYTEGKLHREQAFTMYKPASEIYPDTDDEKPILIQGIIDGYFETDDGVVLMDYKTDRIDVGEEDKLREHYAVQMKLYKEVLEKSLKKPVISSKLYSFSIGKEVEL